MDDYVSKPLRVEELVASLKKAVSTRSQRRAEIELASNIEVEGR